MLLQIVNVSANVARIIDCSSILYFAWWIKGVVPCYDWSYGTVFSILHCMKPRANKTMRRGHVIIETAKF